MHQPGSENRTTLRCGCCNTDHDAGHRDDAVIGAQHPARNQFNRADAPSQCGSAGWVGSPAAASTCCAVGGTDSFSRR
jgi:hypothetical protein